MAEIAWRRRKYSRYGVGVVNKLRIYLDCCCFNRPFDDLLHDKIRFECEAVLAILKKCDDGLWNVLRSDVLDDEIARITNPIKKLKVLMLYSSASCHIEINDEIIGMAKDFQQKLKVKPFDALHLACATYADADILLTTDKKFLSRASCIDAKIKVANPATWLMEVMFYD